MVANDPKFLSESNLKVIFDEVEVNFALVALLTEGTKASPLASIEIG